MSSRRLQISDLRIRLNNAHDSREVYAILESIASLGQEAGLLLPDLLAAIERGLFLPPSPLVPVIALTKSAQLLGAALRQDQWILDTLWGAPLM
jgi:hypothetical protein